MHPFSSEAHQNFEPNYEALQVEYCWNHWYFSPSSLCKSYAPKKNIKKIKCQWWIRRIHRWTSRAACSLDWQFWLIVDMVNALSVTGSPTTAREGSLNENRSMSETKCTLYLRFCVVSFFPLSDFYLFQYIMSLLGARESYSSFLWLYKTLFKFFSSNSCVYCSEETENLF